MQIFQTIWTAMTTPNDIALSIVDFYLASLKQVLVCYYLLPFLICYHQEKLKLFISYQYL